MKFLLFISFALLSIVAKAQECEQEELLKLPGKWKQNQQGQIVNVTAADLAREKATLLAIHKMVSGKYTPMGVQNAFSYVFSKNAGENQTFYGDPYHYAIYILRYLCDPVSTDRSKWYVDVSTTTTVNISVNAIYKYYMYAANLATDDLRPYLKMKQRPVKKDGFYFLGEEVVGDSHLKNKIMEYTWLITYNDTLPFSYVSRKEYLLMERKRLQKASDESPSERKYLAQFFKNIDDYLKMPEDSLSVPAICMWNQEFRFEKFVPEGTYGSFIAIKPNLAYYRKKLPLSSPQFITVSYKLSKNDPAFEQNIAGIQKAVDFAALRNMLGK